jgi:hypothetical protein
MFESRANRATEILGVGRVSINIRNNLEGKKLANRRKTAFRVVVWSRKKHECFKPYYENCKQNMEIRHHCYMVTLKNEIPHSDNVLFDFYDFKTTQDKKVFDSVTLCSLSRVFATVLYTMRDVR